MRTIPDIRGELHVLADAVTGLCPPPPEEVARILRDLAEATRRRRYVRKAPPRSPRMCAQIAHEIRQMAAEMPAASYMEIGNYVGVSVGRVSEVLAGKREGA